MIEDLGLRDTYGRLGSSFKHGTNGILHYTLNWIIERNRPRKRLIC